MQPCSALRGVITARPAPERLARTTGVPAAGLFAGESRGCCGWGQDGALFGYAGAAAPMVRLARYLKAGTREAPAAFPIGWFNVPVIPPCPGMTTSPASQPNPKYASQPDAAAPINPTSGLSRKSLYRAKRSGSLFLLC